MLADGAETNKQIGSEFQVIRASDSPECFEEYFEEFYSLTYIRPDQIVEDDVIMSVDFYQSRMTEAFIVYPRQDNADNYEVIPVTPHLPCYIMTDNGGTFSRVNSGSMIGLGVRRLTNEVGPYEWVQISNEKDKDQLESFANAEK